MGELNQHNIQEYINKYICNIFVETGTGIGSGLSYALKFPFQLCYSIEIIEELYNQALRKFTHNNICRLRHSDSLTGLKNIMEELSRHDRVLFWLDAHFPGADFNLGSYNDTHPSHIKLPLIEEIKLIRSTRPDSRDVFIIDDLNIFEPGNYELGNSTLREQ